MNRLPEKPPSTIIAEKPASNLASLVMNDALESLLSTICKQWNNDDAFAEVAKFGIRPIDKAIFYGPPGNGKTMSSQLIAKELDCDLYRVKCENLIDCYLGNTEGNMSKIFDWLERQPKAVVLFDECETLFRNRSDQGGSQADQVMARTMQIFWQRLDRWEQPHIFLLATNLADRLDPALMSRIDYQIEFGPPTKTECEKVIAYWGETLHQYGAELWVPVLLSELEAQLPVSFRELWQVISDQVRGFIVADLESGDANE